ncbi:MAG: DNA replication and repair protein RecF, partial [Verrucomicrobiota bacterium]
MRFSKVRLQNFRNIAFAEVDLANPRTFLKGTNGQGKSNLLEALGLVMALRSFRTQSMAALVRQGERSFQVFYEIEAENREIELEVSIDEKGKRVILDGERVQRTADFLGQFPIVPLSSIDLMLLRGSPAERRRFLDLTFSVADPEYYACLRAYHRGIADRNRLLKNNASGSEFSAFETEISRSAITLSEKRRSGMDALADAVALIYANIAERDEGPELLYRPNATCETIEEFAEMLRANRTRDSVIGSTQRGPHRDDFVFSLSLGAAKEFGSDGQQRGLCLALRLGQALYFRKMLKRDPVLLADDVLGELDPLREAGFWKACPEELQIIASGTK